MNESNWRPPLQSFDIKTIPTQKLLHNFRAKAFHRTRAESFVSDESNCSETDVRDSDADIPEVPYVIEDIRSNTAVLIEMKGYPRKPLSVKLTLNCKLNCEVFPP